jgi:hypothetical protein
MKTLHQLNRSWPRAVSLALAFLCIILGFAACGNAASSGPQSWPASTPQVTSQFAIADYDGDRRPDLATVRAGQISSSGTRYWIGFQLSSGPRQTLGITAPTGGLQITSRDVNGDDFLDVIVTTAWTNQPVAVLLNDGHGNFTRSSASAFPGAFLTSEKSWTCITDEIKDAVGLLLSRYLAGDCEGASRVSSPQDVARLPISWASDISALTPIVSYFGRAPPFFVLHY